MSVLDGMDTIPYPFPNIAQEKAAALEERVSELERQLRRQQKSASRAGGYYRDSGEDLQSSAHLPLSTTISIIDYSGLPKAGDPHAYGQSCYGQFKSASDFSASHELDYWEGAEVGIVRQRETRVPIPSCPNSIDSKDLTKLQHFRAIVQAAYGDMHWLTRKLGDEHDLATLRLSIMCQWTPGRLQVNAHAAKVNV